MKRTSKRLQEGKKAKPRKEMVLRRRKLLTESNGANGASQMKSGK